MSSFAKCHPILIGSLPLSDHEEAMQVILTHVPELPLWPQLPKNPKEGMIRQFLTGFPGLIDGDNRHLIDTTTDHFTGEMAAFYEEFINVESAAPLPQQTRFGLTPDTSAGFFTFLDHLSRGLPAMLTVKGQITGPITTGIGTRDQDGNSILYDDNLRDMLVKLLALKARWQVEQLKNFTDRVPPIIFIDEPGLVSFGSSGFAAVSREMVLETVGEVVEAIRGADGLAGLHICANGDWGPALASESDIISFDAYFYFDNFILYREPLQQFISRGGILAWGIIPTGDPEVVARESAESLYSKWHEQLQMLVGLGFTERQLMEQTLIAPSCGTGSLSPDLAEKVLAMTTEVSKMARKTFLRLR
jgi:hypothetical protein